MCDATESAEPLECDYTITFGTSYTEEVLEDMTISERVANAITVRKLILWD